MKVAWIILLILGILLILFNLPVYFAESEIHDTGNMTEKIAYNIGRNIGFILGTIFLLISYSVYSKWKNRKQRIERNKIIESIGNEK